MKKLFTTKNLTALCFLLLLLVKMVLGCRTLYYGAYQLLTTWRESHVLDISGLEYLYNDGLPYKEYLLDLNGGFQRLLGMRCVNERYRLDNGQLTYIIPETDITGIADNTVAFSQALEELDIPFVYINTPFKIDPEDKQLPGGVEDYSNENADAFLSILAGNDVPYLDLRVLEKEQNLDHYAMYYVTDHHWTAEMGFWAYQQITGYLAQQDESFAVDPTLTDPDSYDYTVYPNIYLGSAGRRVGRLYAGLDDLTVITPKFDSKLQMEDPENQVIRQGSYSETALYQERLTGGSDYEASRYDVYCGGDRAMTCFTNYAREENLTVQSQPKRLLVIKDSYSSVVAPFLALSYDEVCLLDLREYRQNVVEFAREYQPDMVLVLYNPGALESNNIKMFDFQIDPNNRSDEE